MRIATSAHPSWKEWNRRIRMYRITHSRRVRLGRLEVDSDGLSANMSKVRNMPNLPKIASNYEHKYMAVIRERQWWGAVGGQRVCDARRA